MQNVLQRSNALYQAQQCCHTDGRDCLCYRCLVDGFYGADPDTYACLRKLCYYTMNYGPSYVSEIYHYLAHSQLLESLAANSSIEVLSLGCGFCSDYFAIRKYIEDKGLSVSVNYTGVDIEEKWSSISSEPTIVLRNLLDNPFSLSGKHVVFINKLFSTLKKRGLHLQFLDVFGQRMIPTMDPGSFLVFNDVNHVNMGRDLFDCRISPLMSGSDKYYFNIENAYSGSYHAIQGTGNICTIPSGLSVTPKLGATKSVFFQYRK